jgi:hypothetical protein
MNRIGRRIIMCMMLIAALGAGLEFARALKMKEAAQSEAAYKVNATKMNAPINTARAIRIRARKNLFMPGQCPDGCFVRVVRGLTSRPYSSEPSSPFSQPCVSGLCSGSGRSQSIH